MNVSREGITPRRGNALASRAKAKQACPGIDRIVENLFTALTRAGAGKVEAEVPDRPVRLAVDENEIDKVFATLSDAVARGAVVTIFGGLVRIETGEAGDKGCALSPFPSREDNARQMGACGMPSPPCGASPGSTAVS